MKEKSRKAEILGIPLDKDKAMPLYIQVERYITDRILDGDFEEGTSLPSPRLLAKQNTIGKNTVLNAYDRMVNKGYLNSQPGKYYYVCFPEKHRASIQEAVTKRLGLQERPSWRFELDRLWPKPIGLEGFRYGRRPDIADELNHQAPPQWMDSPTAGAIWDFEVILAKQLNKQYDATISNEHLCLFGGQQHIFSHLAYRLLAGKMALVICPCDPVILSILEENGVIPMAVNLHPGGEPLDLRHINSMCSVFPVSAIVLDRHFYHLTAGSLTKDTMDGLLAIASRHDILVIDHMADHDLWFGSGKYPIHATGKHPNLLQSFHLSTHVSPFCYFGLIIGPATYINNLKRSRQHNAHLPDDGLAESASEALLHGKYQHQHARLHHRFATLRQTVKQSLRQRLGKHVSFFMPPSGLACWLQLQPHMASPEVDGLLQRSGIRILSADRHYLEQPTPSSYLFGFGSLEPFEADQAIAALQELFDQHAS